MSARAKKAWEIKAAAYFDAAGKRVYLRRDLAALMSQHREEWGLPRSMDLGRFIHAISRPNPLRTIVIAAEDYKNEPGAEPQELVRYCWGDASPYAIGVTLRPDSYLSHASAVFLHGLTREIPKTIYVNKEQSPKPALAGALSQEAIDRAFKNQPRVSKYIFRFEDYRFVLLSGKHTERLEVGELELPDGERVDVTKLERTLIDIAVRPTYAGGVFEVAKAYEAARDRLSLATLLATLRKLGYVYPYHQAIGFYLQRAGVAAEKLDKLRALGLQHDFYLTNRIPNARLDTSWRLWVPRDL